MAWDGWQRAWSEHAKTIGYKRRVETAERVALSGANRGKLFCSLSGGKDSAAMAAILEQAGLAETVPLVYAHSRLNFPDTPATVEAIADRLNMELRVIEPDSIDKQIDDACRAYGTVKPQPSVGGYTEIDLLAAIPKDKDITDCLKYVYRACAAGNMLVAYTYEEGFDGSFVGLRAEESSGRERYARYHGSVHRSRIDGKFVVCPLLGWTGMDVMAYVQAREIPLHPFYRAAYESGLCDEDPDKLRVDLTITPGFISAHGAIALIARVYPDFFRELVAVRPELRTYT